MTLIDVMVAIEPRYASDVSMGLSDMTRFVEDAEARLRTAFPDATVMFYGHAGDGDLQMTVGPRATPAAAQGAERQVNEAVYDATRAVGGSISAEHGIGRSKRPWIGWTRSPEEMAMMRAIKTGLDPRGLLNPGKVVPDAEAPTP